MGAVNEHMTKGKSIIDRENGVSNIKQISLKASENGATVPESVKIAGSVSRTGVTSSRQYWDKILPAAGGLSFVALGFYTAKRSSGVINRYIENRWCKPWVVRKTSRLTARDIINHPMEALQKLKEKPSDALSDVIVAPALEGRLRDIATATKDTKQNRRMYKNILLHGPPGTGKTFFATKLALQSGMDYAVVNGEHLDLIGTPSVPALHKVFDWAETSRKGLLLVFEEADVFLRERSSRHSSENLRALLDVFLCRTGEKTNKFMVVLASNKPEQFDSAVNDWLDERVQFQLPGIEERERLIRLYFDEHVLRYATEDKRRHKLAQFDYGAFCVKMARMTEGMSLEDLWCINYFWRVGVSWFEKGDLTEQMFIDQCLEDIERQKELIIWRTDDPNKKTISSQRVS